LRGELVAAAAVWTFSTWSSKARRNSPCSWSTEENLFDLGIVLA